jgi:RNA polymerase sigma-70 factor (ECF subfamily)
MTPREILASGRQARPRVAVDEDAFLAFAEGLDLDEVQHPEDLVLAFACAQGDAAAIEILVREILVRVPDFVARVRGAAAIADEVRQVLSEKLLVAAPRPKLLDYAGKGPLGGWVRVAAVRTAIDLLRARGERLGARADVAEQVMAADGLEVGVLKGRYQGEFQAALDSALAALTPRQRQLLKLHIVDGVTLDELARAHRVHRATVARWIASARDELLERVETRLRADLGLSASEFASLAELVQSRLHASLSLGTP